MKRALTLAILLLTPASAVQADMQIGRLFFTPAQRAALDQARQHNKNLDTANETAPDNITLNGVVKRSDGRHIVWINNRAFSNNTSAESVTVTREKGSGRYTVKLPYSDKRVQLKVGQSMDAASGKVDEAYRKKPAFNPDKSVTPSAIQDQPLPSARVGKNKNAPDETAQ